MERENRSPPPTYPESVGASDHATVAATTVANPTAYEQIPSGPPPLPPNADAARAVVTAAINRLDNARRNAAAGPSRPIRNLPSRTPYDERRQVRREPAAMQPTRRPLQQRLTEPRTRGTAAANRARAVTQRQANSHARRNVRNEEPDHDYYDDSEYDGGD